jgi:hypothetical protein
MATAKQLAALKKGREARAKRLKTPKKSPVKKVKKVAAKKPVKISDNEKANKIEKSYQEGKITWAQYQKKLKALNTKVFGTKRKTNPIGVSQNFAVKVVASGQTAYLSSLKPIRFDTEKKKAKVFTRQAEALAWRSLLDKKYGSNFSVVRLPKS